jgi:hypothetical protein
MGRRQYLPIRLLRNIATYDRVADSLELLGAGAAA